MDKAGEFRAFVLRSQRHLMQTAWLLTGDWGSAEDLVQSALSRTWSRWDRIREMEGPDAYVRRMMVNKSIDWRHRRWSGEIPTAALPDGAAVEADVDLRLAVAAALRSLPPRQRAVIVLRFFDDVSEADTANAMGCSRGTVKSQTSKALASLRRQPLLSEMGLQGSAT